jgi:glycosyltransferase involved in cell wall biosynthesis
MTHWRRPTEKQIDVITQRLDRWVERAQLIITVNNLYPHAYFRDPLYHRLYSAFYERAEVIHHYSETSKNLVCEEYPCTVDKKHVVSVGFNYAYLLPERVPDRKELRRAANIRDEDIVFLTFGALRSWEEVTLLQMAFRKAQVKRKKLLWAASFVETPSWGARWRRLRLRAWQRANNVRVVSHRVPDEEIASLFEMADAIAVVRRNSLNSGLVPLAMTLGKYVISPATGALPELLADSGNALYEPGSVAGLAAALEQASLANRDQIGAENRRIAKGWGWDEAIKACVAALPSRCLSEA